MKSSSSRKSDRRHWLIVCPHYWGRGPSRREALRQLHRAGGAMKRTYLVYRYKASAKAYVNEMGNICWMGPENSPPECVEAVRDGKKIPIVFGRPCLQAASGK